MRHFVILIILVILGCALLASHQRKSFPLLVDEAEATTIICNPQPTPELIRWHRQKTSNT